MQQTPASATCELLIEGSVQPDEYLLLVHVSDIDEMRAGPIFLGKTGVIGSFDEGFRYYAQFVPRLYALDRLVGTEEKKLSMRVESIFSDTVGLSRERSVVRIIRQEQVIRELTAYLWQPLLLFLLPFAFLVSTFVLQAIRPEVQSAWTAGRLSVLMHVSGALFALSMSKVPRALIPSVVAPDTYYRLHILVLVVFTAALTECLGQWIHAGGRPRLARWVLRMQRILTAMCVVATVFPLNRWLGVPIKGMHALIFSVQNGFALATLLGVRVAFWRKIFKFGLSSSRAVVLVYSAMPFALARDTVVYAFDHSSGTLYWIHFCVLAMLGVHAFAAWEQGRISTRAALMVRQLRVALENAPSGQARLNQVCSWFGEFFSFARVSVAALHGNQTQLLATAGSLSRSLRHQESHRPITPVVERVRATRRALYFPIPGEVAAELQGERLSHAFLMIPVVSTEGVRAVISLMGPPDQSLSAHQINLLDRTTHSIQLELLSALSEYQENRRAAELQNMVHITSGLITEYLDENGVFIGDGQISRRVIVSADLVKSTRAAQRAKEYGAFYGLYDQAMSELYDRWIDARNRFDFKSKDPRGDDFWALSDPMGESVTANQRLLDQGVQLAHDLEWAAREVFSQPKYRCLDIPGAHVALVVGNITMRVRGQGQSRSIDTHSEEMSLCAKLRSAAHPGSFLIETSSDRMEQYIDSAQKQGRWSFQPVYDLEKSTDLFLIRPRVVRVREVVDKNVVDRAG